MGYTTEFRGRFELDRLLDPLLLNQLQVFSGTRHENSTGYPGIWCDWVPSSDAKGIEWNGTETFYNYIEWLQYLINHFLAPHSYVLNGAVRWRGEDFDDNGTIVVIDNLITTVPQI